MGFFKQTWTLTRKTLLIVVVRHWASTFLRALILPVIFMFFISYAKNFFVPPAQFGVGSATPVRTLANALRSVGGGHNTVAFVNNGLTGGDIDNVINQLSQTVEANGMRAQVVSPTELYTVCQSSLRGATRCYGAVNFHSSPNEGPGGIWNYTLRADGALGAKVFVDQTNNDQETYLLPLQRAVDSAILSLTNNTLPEVEEYPYTYETQHERGQRITREYQSTVIHILAVAFFIGICGAIYHCVGFLAMERELGMSALIEAMMPNKRRWEPQIARLLSLHLSFDLVYLPSWILAGLIVAYLVFPQSSVAIIIFFHILTGLSLTSYSILFGAFFKTAQLSGIIATIVSIVLAIVAQVGVTQHGSTGAVVILGLFFPPMTYTFFIMWVAQFQRITVPADLGQRAPSSVWAIPGITFWILSIIQIIVFPLLAAMVERILYGTASRSRKIVPDSNDSTVALRLTNFSKQFSPNWFSRKILRSKQETVLAVNNLNLEVQRGQITVFLGANGSGKTTTLDAIAGLSTASHGTIELEGGGLGLCPQKNVLWDELEVFEHVKIFNRLKTTGRVDTTPEIEELVKGCDLDMKMHAKSSTLSGGQKRKLQLAMMLTGGSKICCIDEVSSGIDPLARSKIHEILLAERGSRSLLLTTHFLDEADVLSDRIAIMSKGVLKAEGSAVELKHRLGSGYQISVPSQDVHSLNVKHIPRHVDYESTIFQPGGSTNTLELIRQLEKNDIDYSIQGPTIEEIFLNICEEVQEDTPAQLKENRILTKTIDEDPDATSEVSTPKYEPMHLLPGRGSGLLPQCWALFRKRVVVIKRSYLPYVATLILPIMAGGLVTLFLKGFDPLGCDPGARITGDDSFISAYSNLTNSVYGPPSVGAQLAQIGLDATGVPTVSTTQDLRNFIRANYSTVIPGGLFLGQGSNSQNVFTYEATIELGFSVLIQNVVNNLLSGASVPITTQYQHFAYPYAPGAGSTLQFILYFGLAMSVYPAFFALYPTGERLRKVRALHYSNGVRGTSLWSAYVVFDFIFVLFISSLIAIMWASVWSGWYGLGYVFVVFFLYGLTSVAFSYVVSLFTTSALASFAFAAGTQAVLFLLYFIAYLAIITYAPVNEIDSDITIAHFSISIISPSASMLRALLLTLNEFSILCRGTQKASYPGEFKVFGGPITYLIVQFFLLMAFLIWWDSGGRITLFKKKVLHEKDAEEIVGADEGVAEELSRISTSNNGLRVLHVSKAFGHNLAVDDVTFGIKKGEVFGLLGPNGAGKTSLINLIRGDLHPSSKEGDIFIEGASILKSRNTAHSHLGVCPQFDALDPMTVREHLRFYARVRGVPDIEHNVEEAMRAIGLTIYQNRLASTLSGGNKRKLSLAISLMGNPSVLLLDEPSSGMDAAAKRIMWRVLASITSDRALLVTTHAMEEADALSNRVGILAKRMLALGTTEELRFRHGNAYHVHLVHRQAPHTEAAEMERVKRWVATNIPGVIVEEKTFHGQLRFHVPNTGGTINPLAQVQSMQPVQTTASTISKLPSATITKTRTQNSDRGMSAIFELLERNKEELCFEYYSVSPTTLDQIFLNVVRKHNVEEEDYAKAHAGDVVKKQKKRLFRF